MLLAVFHITGRAGQMLRQSSDWRGFAFCVDYGLMTRDDGEVEDCSRKVPRGWSLKRKACHVALGLTLLLSLEACRSRATGAFHRPVERFQTRVWAYIIADCRLHVGDGRTCHLKDSVTLLSQCWVVGHHGVEISRHVHFSLPQAF